jgi:hypothetical protein
MFVGGEEVSVGDGVREEDIAVGSAIVGPTVRVPQAATKLSSAAMTRQMPKQGLRDVPGPSSIDRISSFPCLCSEAESFSCDSATTKLAIGISVAACSQDCLTVNT